MQKLLGILLLYFCVVITASAQSLVINADGTHSPVIQTGNTVVAINPDGTHSVGMITGNMITVVDPQGRHSVGFIPGNINSITISNPALSWWKKDSRGSCLRFRSRYAEAAPNRFYLVTGKRGTRQWKPQKFQYSFVSQPALKQIMPGNQNTLAGVKTGNLKSYL